VRSTFARHITFGSSERKELMGLCLAQTSATKVPKFKYVLIFGSMGGHEHAFAFFDKHGLKNYKGFVASDKNMFDKGSICALELQKFDVEIFANPSILESWISSFCIGAREGRAESFNKVHGITPRFYLAFEQQVYYSKCSGKKQPDHPLSLLNLSINFHSSYSFIFKLNMLTLALALALTLALFKILNLPNFN
jgi:hypothetical protein